MCRIPRFAKRRSQILFPGLLSGVLVPCLLCASPDITSIREARLNNASEPSKVHVRGIVTGFSGWKKSFFLQDATGVAISIDRRENTILQPGDSIEVFGELRKGLFAPVIESERIHVLGHGALPVPKQADYDTLSQPVSDSTYVRATGIVHSVRPGEIWGNRVLFLELHMPGGQITIYLRNFPARGVPDLVDSTIQVTGICGTIFNRRHMAGLRLFVSDPSNIEILQTGVTFENLPLTPANSLGRFDGPSINHRIKLSGIVTYQDADDAFYLQNGETGIHVQTAAPGKWPPGSRVDAAGFFTPSGYLPVLSASIVEVRKRSASAPAVKVSADQIIQDFDGFEQAPYAGRLVELNARVVDLLPTGGGRMWQLQSGRVQFAAQLPGSATARTLAFEPDTEIELKGICLLDEAYASGPLSFRLLVRSPDDIRVLNTPHLSSSLLLLAILIGLVFAGALTLWVLDRSRVSRAGSIRKTRAPCVGVRELQLLAMAVAVLEAGVQIAVLIGWTCDIPLLELGDSQRRTMPNAALGILLGALALLLARNTRRIGRTLHRIAAASCAAIGAFSLLENALSLDFKFFDQFLIRNLQSVGASLNPARMAAATALCLFLIGLSLLPGRKARNALGFGQVLALAAAITALLNVVATLYGSFARFGAGAHATMALPTALALMLLALATLFSSADHGLMATIHSRGTGGLMARRMIPVAFLLPILLGWLRLQGQLAGLYDTRFGLALLVLANIVCFGFLIWNSAAMLNDIDAARSEAEAQVRERDGRLERILQTAFVGDWTWNIRADQLTAHPVVWALYGAPGHLGPEPASWFQQRQHPDDVARIAAELDAAQRERRPFDLEFRVVHPNGSIHWICCRGKATCDSSGNWIETSGINFDITDRKNAELWLKETEERFRQLAEAMPQIVWTADASGAIEYYNSRWYEYTGASFTTPWEECFHPHDLLHCKPLFLHCIAAGSDYEAEMRMRRASDGVYRWHLSRAVPIRDSRGAIIRWFGTSTDIDDAKQAAAELQKLNAQLETRVQERSRRLAESELQQRLLLQSVKDYAILMLDKLGHIVSWNSGAEKIYGYKAEEILGRHVSIFHGSQNEDGITRVNRWLALAEQNGQFEEEAMRIDKRGRTFWVHFTLTPVWNEDGSLRGFCKVDRNVNDRKNAEDLIRRRNEQLAAANIALSEQTCRAEEANRAKSSFLAAMSHEIRTPMNAILGMADLLWETELNGSQREYVGRFRRAGANLLVLINDILDLSKIEAGRFELESIPFDLYELIDRTNELMEVRARAKNIELTAQVQPATPRYLVGDPGRLQQILNNLIGNAIKFTEKGSVTLIVKPHSDHLAGHVAFDVVDTGIGIPPDKINSIFEDFNQAESSTTRRFGGTGLGLGICRRLITHMGGRLSAHSVLGLGSTFTFDVTVVPGSSANIEPKHEIMDLVGRRVLVIDDNPTDRLVLSETCGSWGMAVSETCEPEQGLQLVRDALAVHQPYSLVLMDGLMPGANGLETLHQLKALDPTLAVILLSSEQRPGDITNAKGLGAAGFLAKPVRRAELLACIEAGLKKDGAQSTAQRPFGASPDDKATAEAPIRILIAEDSEDNRFLLSAYLRKRPYQLTFVVNGRDAVDSFSHNLFDLVLMDVQMPVMDGLQAASAIRALERSRASFRTPILALTANALVEDIERSSAAGCDAHLCKPISKDKLIAAIESFRPAPPLSKVSKSIEIPQGLEQLARNYIASRRRDLARFLSFAPGEQLDELRVFGHNMKGTGAPFGFSELTTLGAAIEAAAKRSNTEELQASLGKVRDYVEYAAAALSLDPSGPALS